MIHSKCLTHFHNTDPKKRYDKTDGNVDDDDNDDDDDCRKAIMMMGMMVVVMMVVMVMISASARAEH